MRLFVALPPPKNWCETLQSETFPLHHHFTALDPRWRTRDYWHITLAFIGQTDTQALPSIIAALEEAASVSQQAQLDAKAIKPFPSNRPNVIALIIENHDTLTELAGRVQGNLSNQGIPQQKRTYKPHMTLARIHHKNNNGSTVGPFRLKLETTIAEKMVLYNSVHTKEGSRYDELASFKLAR